MLTPEQVVKIAYDLSRAQTMLRLFHWLGTNTYSMHTVIGNLYTVLDQKVDTVIEIISANTKPAESTVLKKDTRELWVIPESGIHDFLKEYIDVLQNMSKEYGGVFKESFLQNIIDEMVGEIHHSIGLLKYE